MSRKIDWLDNFAENFGQKLNKTASKKRENVIVDRNIVAGAKLGDTIHFGGKLYKVADLDFEDSKGPGAILEETDEVANSGVEQTPEGPVDINDPMSVSMGAPAAPFEGGQKAQEYARTNPGDVYHYEVRDDVELPAYQQSAAETASEIEKERNFDRSSVQNHYLNPASMPGAAAPMSMESPVDPSVAPVSNEPVSNEPVSEDVAPVDESVEVPTEEVNEEITEEPSAKPEMEDNKPETSEDEEEEEEEEKEEDKEIESFRHNRILRRIMASTKKGGK